MTPGSQLSPSRVGAGDQSVFRLGSKGLLDGPSCWPLEKNLFLLCIEHDEPDAAKLTYTFTDTKSDLTLGGPFSDLPCELY